MFLQNIPDFYERMNDFEHIIKLAMGGSGVNITFHLTWIVGLALSWECPPPPGGLFPSEGALIVLFTKLNIPDILYEIYFLILDMLFINVLVNILNF